jgi:hypothetical protein
MPASRGSERVDRIAAYVEEQYRRSVDEADWHPVFGADYRWEHTLRVAQYGRLIAEEEGLDLERSVVACLLHDVAYFFEGGEADWKDHGRAGARIARPALLEAGFSEPETAEICHAIAVHVDGEPDTPHPHTPLADLVSDADNVDRFSAYRCVLWCQTERDDFRKMADMLRQRIERLRQYREKTPLETATGQRLFAEKVDLQLAFFQAIVNDADITKLPPL